MIINLPHKISLYIHFPFCLRKCAYCDFASEDWQLERIPAFADALAKEIELFSAGQKKAAALKTIYFGGGSPNLFGEKYFRKVMHTIREHFVTDNVEETTIEINPGAITTDFLNTLKKEGVDRISLGCQSFNTNELQTLGRIHSTSEIANTLSALNRAGFSDYSLDFIYGIPGQTLESWRATLEKALQSGATHLSLYCLSYESGTPICQAQLDGKLKPLEDELEWQMYARAHQILEQAGFIHYEISNWAKPGCEAKHNSVYWKGGAYIGFGPSAHSYDGVQRWWNVCPVDDYIAKIRLDQLPVEGREILGPTERLSEFIFLGLRTQSGLNIAEFEKLSGVDFAAVRKVLHDKLGRSYAKIITVRDGHLQLTLRGWFICDTIVEHILTITEEIKNGHS